MANNLTVGDDYLAPCPHCNRKMNMGHITAAKKLVAGYADKCTWCGKEYVINHIDYIPNVWLRKKDDNDLNQEADAGGPVGRDAGPQAPGPRLS